MRDNNITLEGNLVRDVEMQFSPKGHGYTRNAIAVEKRRKDGDDWISDTYFLDINILDERLAENFCDSLSKGDRVILAGSIETRTVPVDKEDPDGDKRTFTSIIVENIGPSLKWATASVTKNTKGNGNSSAGADFFDE